MDVPRPLNWSREALWRYILLATALVTLLCAHSWTDSWRGDFWIYVAAVDELAVSPTRPANALFGNHYPFAFYSPYTFALGLVSRLTSVSPFAVLVLQGVLNLLLLLAALYAFTVTWLGRPAAAFYALLFMLFLWGREPWLFSSFFHLRSLALVLPYPSTFAAALALGALAAFPAVARGKSRAMIAAGVGLGAVLWIIHPVNALFLCLGALAYGASLRRPLVVWAWVALGACASIALATAWPLFPAAELWTQQVEQVHEGNAVMYDHPLSRVAPALLGVPWLFVRLRRNARDPLALLALALGAVVLYGGLFGKWSYGRLISHAVLLCQVGLADATAVLEERIARSRFGTRTRHLLAPVAVALLVTVSWSSAVRPTLDEAGRGDPFWLAFLQTEVGRSDVVLTDLEGCWYVPAFRGKVVAYPMPLPFVPDHEERVRAVQHFFARGTSRSEREDTMERYRVAYVLVPHRSLVPEQATPQELRSLGRVVYSNAEYELLRTRRQEALAVSVKDD